MPRSYETFGKAREERQRNMHLVVVYFGKRKQKYSPFRAEKTDMSPIWIVLDKARVEILIARSEKKEHLRSEPRI